MKIQLKIAIILVCLYGIKSSATDGVYKGTPLLADEWVCKKTIQKIFDQQIALYKGHSNYQDIEVAAKILQTIVNKEQTAGDLGYIVIQPDIPPVETPWPWMVIGCTAIPSAILGAIIVKCFK